MTAGIARAVTNARAALVVALTLAGKDALGAPPKDVSPPVVLERTEPAYPPDTNEQHADVVLFVTIDRTGNVTKVEVHSSAGSAFDDAAITAVRRWKFKPAERNGQPVASRVQVALHFDAPARPAQPSPRPATPVASAPSVGPLAPAPVEEVHVAGTRIPPTRGGSDFRIDTTTLSAAPHASAADLLATAPGVYVAHPEGEAIAQRIYLRGFDAEHGQDIELRVGSIPINQPSHVHGQGYADLGFIIPETVRSIRVLEGVYDPAQGDFAVAGSATFDLGVRERAARIKATYGSFNTRRLLALWAPAGESEETFVAAFARTTDGFGPAVRAGTGAGATGQYRFALGASSTATLQLVGYGARAATAGALRRDDVERGAVGFYDAYPDPSAQAQSAEATRFHGAIAIERRLDSGARLELSAFLADVGYRSRLNFTGHTQRSRTNPEWVGRGDLNEQSNGDLGLGGGMVFRSKRHNPFSWLASDYVLGSEVGAHTINQAQNLLKAPQNETWDRRVDATVRAVDVGLYGDLELFATRLGILRVGARADALFYDVDDRLGNFIPAFSQKTYIQGFRRTAAGIVAGPRASLDVPLIERLHLVAAYGEGYRSPQARQLEEGERAPFAKVRSYEGGVRVSTSSVAMSAVAYETRLSYDLAFDPVEGSLQRVGPTTRRGLAGFAHLSAAGWFDAIVSATYVSATLDSPPPPTATNPAPPFVAGQSLPYVPPFVVRQDVAVHGVVGYLFGQQVEGRAGYGTTFLAPRPLPFGDKSAAVFLLDAMLAARVDRVGLQIDAINLLDARYADTEYTYVSNWIAGGIPSEVPARHFTAGAPRTLLASVSVYF